MHAFDRPVTAHIRTQSRRIRRHACHIQPFFVGMRAWGFFDCVGFTLYNRHLSSPPHFFGDNFKSVIYVIGSCLYSSMTEFGTFRIEIQRYAPFDPVLHPITQRSLVRFGFYKEITSFPPDYIDDVFLH